MEEKDEDPFDLEKDFQHEKEAESLTFTKQGKPKENEGQIEGKERHMDSDHADILLLEPLPKKQKSPVEMPVTDQELEDKPLEGYCTEVTDCEPVPITQTEQKEIRSKRVEKRKLNESDNTDILLLERLPKKQKKSISEQDLVDEPLEGHCMADTVCEIVPLTQTEQRETRTKRAEKRNLNESDIADISLLEFLPKKQQKRPVSELYLESTPLEEHCTKVTDCEPVPYTQPEKEENRIKMAEKRNPINSRCEDCEDAIADFYCQQCLNVRGVFGIALCQPCSDVLHKGATRRFHVLEDLISSSKRVKLQEYTINEDELNYEEEEDEYIPSKESENEANDDTDTDIDENSVIEGDNFVADSSDTESIEIPVQTVKCNEIKLQQPVKNANAKRANKYHSCPFCDNVFFKLPRHLEQKHFIEIEVRKALAFPKKSKERRKALLDIQNLGDYNHNCRVLSKGSGVLIPKYITKKGRQMFQKINYIPCEFCLALYKKKELWKHHRHCPKRPADENLKVRNAPVSAGRMLLPSNSGSTEFNRHILNNMKKEDDIKEKIVSDKLILSFGERLYELHGHNQHHLNYISNRLRELGRLMTCVSNNDAKVSSLEECLNPRNFDLLITSVKKVAGYSVEDGIYQIPSLPLRLGQSLEKCANILKCKSIENGLKDIVERMDNFLALYNLEWTNRISLRAHATLNLAKFNRPQMLPLVEDVVLLHKHLDNKLQEVSKQDFSFREQYVLYCEIILTQVILFNRRRSGEAQRIRLKDFKVVEESTVDEQIVESLTPFERELCKCHKRVEIIGKKGGKVPVIFTNKMVMDINKILQLRKEFHVPNDFLFGRPDSKFPFRGCDCIRKFASQCGAKKPDLITSTQLRKQLATMCQVLGLTENNQDVLAKFLGHDIRVHRHYYRLPDSVYQLGKVTKVLHAINSGSVSQYAGKNFEDIEFSNEDTLQDETLDEEFINSNETDDDEEIYEELHLNQENPKSKRANKVSTKAKPWSKEEKEAIERRLGKFLQQRKLPGKKDCEEAKLKETALKNRSWEKIKHYVRNRNAKISSIFK